MRGSGAPDFPGLLGLRAAAGWATRCGGLAVKGGPTRCGGLAHPGLHYAEIDRQRQGRGAPSATVAADYPVKAAILDTDVFCSDSDRFCG